MCYTQIRKNITNKIFSSLKDLLQNERVQFENFWSEFGPTLKEGIPTDPTQKDKLQDLLLFHSTQSDRMTTLEEYVSRMPTEQKDIYFITGDDLSQLNQSPYLEKLKEKNFEVLLLVDHIDEWVTQGLLEFKDKKLVSVAKAGLDLDTSEEKASKDDERKMLTEKYSSLIEKFKKTLEADVKDVLISDRLTSTPVCLVTDENDPSAQMQKIISQMGKGEGGGKIKRILEINPKHPLFEKTLSASEEQQGEWAELLYAQALLNEGSQLPNPAKFSRQVADLMIRSMS